MCVPARVFLLVVRIFLLPSKSSSFFDPRCCSGCLGALGQLLAKITDSGLRQ